MDEEQYKIILQKTWLQMGNGERKKGGCVREGGVGGGGREWLVAMKGFFKHSSILLLRGKDSKVGIFKGRRG